MLIYAKNEAYLGDRRVLASQEGCVDEVLARAEQFWRKSGKDASRATEMFKAWMSTQKHRFTASITNYNRIDDEGRVFYGDNPGSPNLRPNLMYDIATGHGFASPQAEEGLEVRRRCHEEEDRR